jgi:uncharacterized membrane protein
MEVTLNRKGWHAKLHKWVTGKQPTHWSLCPYFWKTLFFMAISPLVLLKKIVFSILGSIFNPIIERCEEKSRKKEELHWEKLSKDESYRNEYYNKKRKESWWSKNEDKIERIAKFIGKTFVVLYFLAIGAAGVYGIVTYIMAHGFGAFAITLLMYLAIIIGIIVLVAGVFYLIHKFFHSDTWEATKGMAYSFKNKVCPAINWK